MYEYTDPHITRSLILAQCSRLFSENKRMRGSAFRYYGIHIYVNFVSLPATIMICLLYKVEKKTSPNGTMYHI